MQTHSYSVCTGVSPPPRPLFSPLRPSEVVSAGIKVFFCFCFIFIFYFLFYWSSLFIKDRACVEVHRGTCMCRDGVFSRCARPRLPPPRCECVSASWITFENKTTGSHISGIHVLVCFVSSCFSPLTFGSSSFLLKQVYVILPPLPLSFCAWPISYVLSGRLSAGSSTSVSDVTGLFFFLILLFCFLGHIAHTVHAFVIKKTGNEGTQM